MQRQKVVTIPIRPHVSLSIPPVERIAPAEFGELFAEEIADWLVWITKQYAAGGVR